jgi:hypothetical protein
LLRVLVMLAVQGWCVANCIGQSGGTEQSTLHLVTYTHSSLAMKRACSNLAAGMTKVGPANTLCCGSSTARMIGCMGYKYVRHA